MNKRLFDKIAIVMIVCLLSGCTGCNIFSGCHESSNAVSSETAEEKKEEHRYLTIIDKTNLAINKVSITTAEGIQIYESGHLTEPSISVEIGETWKEYRNFHITFEDVYGLHYEADCSIPDTGNTIVSISQNDYKEYSGDWKRKLDKLANGD